MAWEKNEPLKGPDGEPLSADVAESGPHDEKGLQGEKEWVRSNQNNDTAE
jgi:hypothetical protein